jgi:hypothetical protein
VTTETAIQGSGLTGLCPSCPARTQADTLEALADAAEQAMLPRPFVAPEALAATEEARAAAEEARRVAEEAHKRAEAERTMLIQPFVSMLRKRAQEIREAGCEWLWSVEWKDDSTGQKATRTQCGRASTPAWLEHFAKENTLTAQTIQAERNETSAAMQRTEVAMQQTEALARLLLHNQAALVERLEQASQRLAESTLAAIASELDSRGLLLAATNGEEATE